MRQLGSSVSKIQFQESNIIIKRGKRSLWFPLTSVSASAASSVPWVRSFGFFHVFGAVAAGWAAIQAQICYNTSLYGANSALGNARPSHTGVFHPGKRSSGGFAEDLASYHPVLFQGGNKTIVSVTLKRAHSSSKRYL